VKNGEILLLLKELTLGSLLWGSIYCLLASLGVAVQEQLTCCFGHFAHLSQTSRLRKTAPAAGPVNEQQKTFIVCGLPFNLITPLLYNAKSRSMDLHIYLGRSMRTSCLGLHSENGHVLPTARRRRLLQPRMWLGFTSATAGS
jgi:hypothetical protein